MRDRSTDAHRRLTEREQGRKLGPDEIVHHKDGDKSNNAQDNREIKSRRAHSRDHAKNPGLLRLQKSLTMHKRGEKLY